MNLTKWTINWVETFLLCFSGAFSQPQFWDSKLINSDMQTIFWHETKSRKITPDVLFNDYSISLQLVHRLIFTFTNVTQIKKHLHSEH